MKKVLTIAGSDSGGGAGIQADLKTFMAFGTHGMSAITAITAQNTVGVQSAHPLPRDLIREQIKSVADDIGVDAVKTGMLASSEIVQTVADAVREFTLPNLVVDPVMIAKSGDPLLAEEARETIREELLPLAAVITPNLHEASELLDMEIDTIDDMEDAARALQSLGCQWVVVKGGHLTGEEAVDVLFDGNRIYHERAEYIKSENTHGTGCTFSSAIAAGLAKGNQPLEAIRNAKRYINEAIREGLDIGAGHGPTNHLVGLESRWF
ncbi:MAG: bifunctional hydroxymethylpyrimidine kinase/phosphomethylpyrimidine kinase [Candidatus Marinimicrobia bacterium]|nr:bifunctional hydroxymethylpyrimidine kinase/phosphomethylpyrimidine kinase [Candidatus Neomarinimicrobiota bacterium]MCF7828886.1 bifunctional hydroxymethylpyrimidine kinase/phosphomethylpyrimidine kinase [Candidatus Neomarinimicrobiota bacterium]MCF7879846.1 bifunctional hydroxymethylpyrimidine kinase/phosphomethylpyrimidine kinase [Candidatus Neomarinimicrobiota bacterium]